MGHQGGELCQQPFPGDEFGADFARVVLDEQPRGIPQLVTADLGGAPHLVQVAAGGGLNEVAVQTGEALQVPAGGFALHHADVLAGAGIQPVGHMLDQQQHGHHHADGYAAADRGRGSDQAEHGDDCRRATHRDGQHGQTRGGAPGQPAQREPLQAGGRRGEDADAVGTLGQTVGFGDGQSTKPQQVRSRISTGSHVCVHQAQQHK
ncbi:hypothetical protein ACFYWH_34255 [Streptomyces sp. NPDC003737]|uniref:hypothetical protein n=1 Tax=Streptomyces sp. NPDC003737 TaxID=3364685 RepID=UPI0036C75C1F